MYHNAIDAFDLAAKTPKSGGNALATYSIFATFPAKYFGGGYVGPLIDQIVGTAFLLMFVVALIDERNSAVGSNLAPLAIGLAVLAIGNSFGRTRDTPLTRRVISTRLFAYFSAGERWPYPGPTMRRASISATTGGYQSWVRSSAA